MKNIFLIVMCLNVAIPSVAVQVRLEATNKLKIGSTTLEVVAGDLLRQDVDAVVNAANTTLVGSAGIAPQIQNAAYGSKQAWRAYLNQHHPAVDSYGNRIDVGEAMIMPVAQRSDLRGRNINYVVNAVGPDCQDKNGPQNRDRKQLLYNAYYNSLEVADRQRLSSIGFPSISTNIFAYEPVEEAGRIAIKAATDYVRLNPTTNLRRIVFVGYQSAGNRSEPSLVAHYKAVFARFAHDQSCFSNIKVKVPHLLGDSEDSDTESSMSDSEASTSDDEEVEMLSSSSFSFTGSDSARASASSQRGVPRDAQAQTGSMFARVVQSKASAAVGVLAIACIAYKLYQWMQEETEQADIQ